MKYQFFSADVSLTLMVVQEDGSFLPTDVMTYPYYVLAEETFTEDLPGNAKNLFCQLYDEHYDAFKLREPNDPNYIAVVDVIPNILQPDEYANKPWLLERIPAWENSNCIVVQNNSYRKVEPGSMAAILRMP